MPERSAEERRRVPASAQGMRSRQRRKIRHGPLPHGKKITGWAKSYRAALSLARRVCRVMPRISAALVLLPSTRFSTAWI
jgi:hypothetical protein